MRRREMRKLPVRMKFQLVSLGSSVLLRVMTLLKLVDTYNSNTQGSILN